MKRQSLIILIMLIMNPFVLVYANTNNQYKIDGTPLAALLVDELNTLYSGNYEDAARLAKIALQSNLTGGLDYVHKKTWSNLEELAIVLQAVKEGRLNEEEAILKLYRLKLELEDLLPNYMKQLIPNIRDSTMQFKYWKLFNQYTLKLDDDLDNVIRSVLMEYTHKEVNLVVYTRESVYAGETIPVSISIMPPVETVTIKLVLKLRSGIILNTSIFDVNDTIGEYVIPLKIPNTEIGVYSRTGVDSAEITVSVKGFYRNASISLVSSKSLRIQTIRPKLYFKIPSAISLGDNLSFNVISEVNDPLRMNVIIASLNESVLLNTTLTVYPGSNHLMLNTSWLDEGIYTIVFKVEPFDKYLSREYSKAFVVTSKTIMGVEGPMVVIGPPFLVTLSIRLNNLNCSSILVKSRGKVIAEYPVHDTSPVKIQVPLNWVFLKSNRTIVIEAVSAEDNRTIQTEVYVPVINILTILVLSMVTFSISTASAQGFVASLEEFTIRLRRIQRRGQLFRSYNDMIKHLMGLLSRYANPPRASETLREYYRRVVEGLSRSFGSSVETVSRLLWRLILFYEEVLYSPRKPDYRVLQRVYDELVRRLR